MSPDTQQVIDALVQSGPAVAAPLYQAALDKRAARDTTAAMDVVAMDFQDDCADYYQAHYGDSGFAERWSELAQFLDHIRSQESGKA